MNNLSKKKEQAFHLLNEAKELDVINFNLDPSIFRGRTITVGDKKLLHFANCSYLGLENDPRLIESSNIASQDYGIIQSNSRAFFSSPLYSELEGELKKIFNKEVVVTATTTLGHCSALPLLTDKDDLIIVDIHAHNSLQMACKLCAQQGTTIKYLKYHNNINKLKEMINQSDNDHYKRIWFVGDGVYSMQGDFIDIKSLIKLLDEKERLYTYIDDAHGFSWTGKNGRGYVLGEIGEIHPKMIVAVSMSKSFGSSGGILVFPNKSLRDRINLIGQTQIFSGPLTNPVLGAAIASAKIHRSTELEILQEELKGLINYFRERCFESEIPLKTHSVTPIQFIEIGRSDKVYQVARKLIALGIYCSVAVYPSRPLNHGGLRVSLTLHLNEKDIDFLINQLIKILEIKPLEVG
ncbi:aminotransferase class I/II-fold pyridoxal phosphate-dependent enzyme [Flammeovirga aprica]|uniref:Aminotransferase class I/II-fold pyridoxal phosphate-dependent enzyme n=1 Tax=Flammeovirga aprica JL-4 TaxID=694437 RepID=A0A7X9XAL3_9BACT|nr:aminotransferase class I/II-fold pyridoxal phosphate-dependent enzyme [Flammeovirga aprica]NME69792.1 aminotransferase class I/II-fold pyridoxal phosphate-dependent enzyme [Flammeovirga aprica JL-4]